VAEGISKAYGNHVVVRIFRCGSCGATGSVFRPERCRQDHVAHLLTACSPRCRVVGSVRPRSAAVEALAPRSSVTWLILAAPSPPVNLLFSTSRQHLETLECCRRNWPISRYGAAGHPRPEFLIACNVGCRQRRQGVDRVPVVHDMWRQRQRRHAFAADKGRGQQPTSTQSGQLHQASTRMKLTTRRSTRCRPDPH